jgi:ATP-dependent Clp protease protease subunit
VADDRAATISQHETKMTVPMARPSPNSYDEYLRWHDFLTRTIHLDVDLSPRVASDFRRITNAMVTDMLAPHGDDSDRTIQLVINSGGGSVTAGFDIVSQIRWLQRHGIKVRARLVGQAASMAAVVAAVADHCEMSSLAGLMWHGISQQSAKGDINEMVLTTEQLAIMASKMSSILLARARRVQGKRRTRFARSAYIDRIMRDDAQIWIYAEEALEAGLVDEIVD